MSEETEQSDKQSELKEKLKQMGVMQDENAVPQKQPPFILRHKLPIMFVVIVVGVLVWWSSNNDNGDTSDVAQGPSTDAPYMRDPYMMPPPPPPPMPESMPAGQTEQASGGNQPPSGWGAPPPRWNPPATREGDIYGPPPGPSPSNSMYRGPYGYYPPPPPPAFYRPYGPYGPRPYYGNPYYGGNYPPPPGYR